MRVISGKARGRILTGPKSDKIRPALDKVKQAVFNILGDIEGLTILDLFAGTGSVGIEALSRGAKQVVFVDTLPEALTLTHKNSALCRFEDQSIVLKLKIPEDISKIERKSGVPSFDLIFSDPPYDRGLVNPTLKAIAKEKILAPQGMVIVESSPREIIAGDVGLTLVDQRKYGQTLISFLRE